MGRTVNPLALLSVVRIRSSPPFKFWDYILDKFYHYDPHNAGVAQW